MSLTSCFKYAIELPESTLTALIRSVIAQGDTSELPLTFEDPNRPINGYLARISARLVDSEERPSVFDLTAVDLAAVLHLHMEIEVTIQDVVGLDPIFYLADFQLPGVIARNDADPVQLEFHVGAITTADLNLVVSGGELVFTVAFFDPYVHQMFADNEDLHNILVPNVDTIVDGVVTVQVELYDNPTDGEIVVQTPGPGVVRVRFPGRMRMYNISGATLYDFLITLVVDIDYETQPGPSGGDEMVVKIGEVQNSDVGVEYGTGAPAYQALMTPFIQTEVVGVFAGMGDIREPIPSDDHVQQNVGEALVDFVGGLVIRLFPLEPTSGSIPIDTAVPTTINSEMLALQIEDEPGEPCEGPDDFTQAAQVAIAMGALEVQRRLDEAADDINGQEIEVEGYDVTLHRPTVSLADAGEHGVAEGHIWVDGNVTIHVGGCVGDVDADYYGPLMLDPVMNPDQTIGFQIRAGTFGGDADVKDKKDEFDPDEVADFIENWNFDFPTIPRVFEGVGTIVLSIDTAEISREGIVLRGGVQIQLLHELMIGSVLPSTLFWAFEGTRGG